MSPGGIPPAEGANLSRPLRSLLDPEALLSHVRSAYALAEAGRCVLLRSLVNDVYRVDGAQGSWILKVYGSGGPELEEVRWEMDLIQHLIHAGLPTPAPLPLSDGTLAAGLPAPEGVRPAVLLEAVRGSKPVLPVDTSLRSAYGELTARLHALAAGFRSRHHRPALTLDRMLERALPAVLGAPLAARDRTFVLALVDRVRGHMGGLIDRGLDWGVCQGDVSLDNVLVRADGSLLVYDFDAAGEGWRAGDLTGPRLGHDWPDFVRGYRTVRSLGDRELEAVDWMVVPQMLEGIRFHLEGVARWRGELEVSDTYVDTEVARLREWATGALRIDV